MSVPYFTDTGSGEPILFLHGIGGNATNWDPQVAGLSDRFRCIVWTMPGYGTSPALDDLTFPALADAAARLLDHLGLDQAHICGLSMGGYVAQEMALRHPERCKSLILMCTSPSFGKPGSDFNNNFLAARLEPIDAGKRPADFAEKLVDGMVGPNATAVTKATLIASMGAIGPDAYRAALNCLVTFNRKDDLAGITCPVQLIAGEEDNTAPAKVMASMAKVLPDVRMETIPGAGHLANLEAPEETNRIISTFMQEF